MAIKALEGLTGKAAASAAARVLADPGASKSERKAAASALTLSYSHENTGKLAAMPASTLLRNPKASRDAKTAPVPALTQKLKAKAPARTKAKAKKK